MTIKTIGAMSLIAVTLGGCMVFGGPNDRALRRTPSFKDGYSDGCAAASTRTANPRDRTESLANEDKIYRRGYASGYQTCRTTTVAPGDAPVTPVTGSVQTPNRY